MKNKKIALDSNIFIYQFESNTNYTIYTDKIFHSIANNSNKGITSIISLIESLSYPSPPEVIEQIKESFRTLPNLQLIDINQEVGIIAAKIRRTYKYRLPDAIQLATALYGKADVFITNDKRMHNFKEIKVLLLEEVTL